MSSFYEQLALSLNCSCKEKRKKFKSINLGQCKVALHQLNSNLHHTRTWHVHNSNLQNCNFQGHSELPVLHVLLPWLVIEMTVLHGKILLNCGLQIPVQNPSVCPNNHRSFCMHGVKTKSEISRISFYFFRVSLSRQGAKFPPWASCSCMSLCPAGTVGRPVGTALCPRLCAGAALTSTVCEAIQGVALVAGALEGAGVVDARVVARPLEGALVDVCKVSREASEPLGLPREPWAASRAQKLRIYGNWADSFKAHVVT